VAARARSTAATRASQVGEGGDRRQEHPQRAGPRLDHQGRPDSGQRGDRRRADDAQAGPAGVGGVDAELGPGGPRGVVVGAGAIRARLLGQRARIELGRARRRRRRRARPEAGERQAQARRGIARHEEQVLAARLPALGRPSRAVRPASQRHDVAGRRAGAAIEGPGQASAGGGVGQVRAGVGRRRRWTIGRQRGLAGQERPRVVVDRLGRGRQLEGVDQRAGQAGRAVGRRVDGEGARRPQRRAVAPAAHVEGPARQRLVGILLAEAVEDDRAGRQAGGQLIGQAPTLSPLGRAEGGGVPLR
jgi:hypothetical protein